jgi:hypothetical protein
MNLLADYLARERDTQILFHRIMLLWASARTPGLLTAAQRESIIDEALAKQQPDGGFSLSAFVGSWKRRDNTRSKPKATATPQESSPTPFSLLECHATSPN